MRKLRAIRCLCGLMLAAALLIGVGVCAADRQVIDPTDHSRGYSAVLYNNTNGLPTSEANAIAETPDGFLWIGSYAGLIRYDGNTFERLDSTGGLASVVSLFADSRGRLWVGTNDSGIGLLGKGQFRMYKKADGLRSLSVRAIAEDEHGEIYVGTTLGVAVIDENENLTYLDAPQINDEYVRFLKLGNDGVIYGITKDGDVFTMRDRKVTGFYGGSSLLAGGVRAVLPDPERPGWVYLAGAESDIYHGELEKGFIDAEPEIEISLDFVNTLEILDDELWVCADNGIGLVQNGVFRSLDMLPANTSIEQVIADYQGNLWFASSQQGLMKIVANQFEDLFDAFGLESEVVYSTCLYQGRLFIGTKDSGLVVIENGKAMEALPLTSAVASGEPTADTDLLQTLHGVKIRSIVRDSRDRLWICTFGKAGLMRYDGETLMRFGTADGLPSDRVRTVFERKDGTFLVACTGGAAILDGDRVTRVYNETDGISNTEVLTISESADGDILLGTDGGGIYRIHDGKAEHFDTGSGLASDVVMRMKKDTTRDLFWIVTSNSLAYMTGDGEITTIQQFPYSNNFDLYENSRGEMWILASNGIYVVPAEELIANGAIEPVYYNRDNGLSCITTANSYSELTEDGDLYISGTTGVVRVNIEAPEADIADIKMAVPYLEADGERVYADDSGVFTIPASTQKLTVRGYVYTYALSNPQVTYYLEGFDQTATTVSRKDLTAIDYTNLSGGNYRFVMRLDDPLGHGSKELAVDVVKPLRVGETLWFRALLALLLLGVVTATIVLLFRRKTKALLAKQEENRTLIREITEAFAKTIDMKDNYTNGHSSRVAKYTAMLTKELGYDDETVEKYYNIALLHDIGKIGVPSTVLNKPGKLTDEEYHLIQSHSAKGFDVLKDISIMPELAIGAGAHHERPDGKGYPNGLTQDDIPRVAQIISVADTFDAMYSTRPYRPRMNFEKVLAIIKEAAGTQLTPDVVDALLRLAERGELRDPDDNGGGSTEDISNIRGQ